MSPIRSIHLSVVLIIFVGVSSVKNGTVEDNKLVDPALIGLYETGDKVLILSKDNFNDSVFNKDKANFVEFYNSWCGHCRRFAPIWKQLASDVNQWNPIVAIAAIDCADDKNNDICRDFEILQYPTLKFFHQKFKPEVDKLGDIVIHADTPQIIEKNLVLKLQQEQNEGRGIGWPTLTSKNLDNLSQVWTDMAANVKAVFLIIESENSTMGAEVILDLNSVFGIGVMKISDASPLAKSLEMLNSPSLAVVSRDLSYKTLRPKDTTRISYRKSIIDHMQSNNFKGIFELNDFDDDPDNPIVVPKAPANASKKELLTGDVVYLADLETTLIYTLTHEIPKLKYIHGETLVALKRYLNVLAKYFPFSSYGKLFISKLLENVENDNSKWTGKRFAKIVEELETTFFPVYSTTPKYIGCLGSSPQYRGFTCGLWTMFHVLTVNANNKQSTDASEVLAAMYGYVKYFFGCTECSEHFQKLAGEKYKTVAETDGAIIWLWTAHNEVNHRLAGDITEDPFHPKKQFPTIENCPKCHAALSWDFKEVLKYLKFIYGVEQIDHTGTTPPNEAVHFPSFDSSLFILLYIYFAVMIISFLRLCLTKRIYRKKVYIHDTLGKV